MLYNAYQLQSDLLSPMRLLAQGTSAATWWHNTERTLIRSLSAVSDVLARMRLTHTRPAYGIDQVEVAGRMVPVVEEQAFRTPFGTLLHFRKEDDTLAGQPPVLLVAPLSGHFATLLRETTRTSSATINTE